MTRGQMTDLTFEVYLKLNNIEDYQMPESQFKENFIIDFIAQAAHTTFPSIKIVDALKLLMNGNVWANSSSQKPLM